MSIVEGFKLRRQTGVFLDNPASVVGPGLQMGDGDSLGAGALGPADVELETSHIALMLRRAAIRTDEEPYLQPRATPRRVRSATLLLSRRTACLSGEPSEGRPSLEGM